MRERGLGHEHALRICGDVWRPRAMTVEWARYARSLTSKPMKGMLTGPVTILCWSFVREDLPRSEVALQIAAALSDEVLALEAAGLPIIQIDEPALREGLPLQRREWAEYLSWAVAALRASAAGVREETQIHTHMCYSQFRDILGSVSELDADVVTIESARSGMAVLEEFSAQGCGFGMGPGIYDIHSPRVPAASEMRALLDRALQVVPMEKLWVNPDCGLKTRAWEETEAALERMVSVAREARAQLAREMRTG